MRISPLTVAQLRDIYLTHMVRDFPDDELKPMKRITDGMATGMYECLGMYSDADELLCYACFVRTNGDLLLDYFATVSAHRDMGHGSKFLSALVHHYASADSLLVEIEDPAAAKDESERRTRKRRADFYTRCGFRDTGVRTDTFGVIFILLEPGNAHTADEVSALYAGHYRAMLPAAMYEKNIHIF